MTHKAVRPRTHKIRNAAIAGALGIGLLAAGGGTFANWYEAEEINGGTIAAGELDMVVDTPVWTANGNPTPIDPATFVMVPGDIVTYTANVTPTLVGDNIQADITVDETQLTGSMATFVTATTTVDGVLNQALTKEDTGISIPVVVTLDLPFTTGDANGTDAEKTSLDLTSLVLDLTQTDATP